MVDCNTLNVQDLLTWPCVCLLHVLELLLTLFRVKVL